MTVQVTKQLRCGAANCGEKYERHCGNLPFKQAQVSSINLINFNQEQQATNQTRWQEQSRPEENIESRSRKTSRERSKACGGRTNKIH